MHIRLIYKHRFQPLICVNMLLLCLYEIKPDVSCIGQTKNI